MRKRLLTLGCTAALTLAYFTAPTALAEENTEASTEAESYITVTDMNGRDVQVPTEIDSVVLTALPLPSIYALTGAPDRESERCASGFYQCNREFGHGCDVSGTGRDCRQLH